MTRLVFVSMALASLAVTMTDCGSDDNASSATATATPTPHLTSTRSPPINPTSSPPTITTQPTPIGTPTYSPAELSAALETNRAKWNAAGIKSYQFQFTISCFCGFPGLPITMVVHNSELVSMTDSSGALVTAGPAYDVFQPYSTVERMFQRTETDIHEASGVVVTYDDQYGFPIEILVGSRGMVTDSGSAVGISQFEILQ